MHAPNKTIKKYLEIYAEPEIIELGESLIPLVDSKLFSAVLVLPVFDEAIENINHFLEFATQKSVVMIWVFNCPDNARKEEQLRTKLALNHFLKILKATAMGSACHRATIEKNKTIYLLDRCSQGKTIPAKQGVGLARKLGMDLALMLINQQQRQSGKLVPFIHSTDADVTLPARYFDVDVPDTVVLNDNCSAIIYPFKHQAEKDYEQAIALYDFSLRYYVDRLNWAGSPYAFHTIGSLIAVSPLAYAQVRGMPKRSGAEDFYLLNKLAKVGEVIELESPTVTILGRPSHRVPFGTGPALSKIKVLSDPLQEYRFYHPDIFVALKALLGIVSETEQSIASTEMFFKQVQDRMFATTYGKVVDGQVVDGQVIAEQVIETLQTLKFEKQFRHLSQKLKPDAFIKAFHIWFDAFVTLRFIHIMRDNFYPNITLQTLENFGVYVESHQ